MTGRERVLRVLERKEPDAIPFDIGGTDVSSIHVLTYKALREKLGLPDKPLRCGCLIQLIVEMDEDMRQALSVDVEALHFASQKEKTWRAPFGVELIVPDLWGVEDLPDGSSVVKNAAGTVYAKRAADACYFDPVGAPLADIQSPADLDRFDALFERWDYSSVYDEPIKDLAERARKQYEATDRAVVALWRAHYLQTGQIMRGYDTFFIDLALNTDLVHAMMQKLHDVYMKRIDAFLATFGEWFDVALLTDDLGTQQTGMISPTMYREMIYPYMAELVGRIKAAGKKVLMHSCGAVSQFIPSLIEMGVDALNPVQVSADGMNPSDLVREFGKDIAFWGGGCDTQHALNASDPELVRADVRKHLDEFGPTAPLVFTQVHNIQYDIPPENVLAMRDEFMKRTRG